MNNQTTFLVPGSEGHLAPGVDIWRKGLVYTKRLGIAPQRSVGHGHRVSAAFKRKVGASHPFTGYGELYRRVRAIASLRISELTRIETGETPSSVVLGHGWMATSLGDRGEMAAAFITLEHLCSDPGATKIQGEPEPTEEALMSPGGATLEEIARLAPQRANELYSEFDFTEPSTAEPGLVTLSYGESVSDAGAVDFRPFVERAEGLAKSYRTFLESLGEVCSPAFRIVRREWFLADRNFVTIHICFDR